MSSFKNHKSLFIPVALLALLVAGALFAFGLTGTTPVQAAPLKGAIFTTTPDGGIVNENVHYTDKKEVYLDGGPRNSKASSAGLDDGLYVFQITNPSGAVLLSEDKAQCRVFEVVGGVITKLVVVDDTGTPTGDSHEDDDVVGAPISHACHEIDGVDAVAGPLGTHDINNDSETASGDDIVVQMMPFLDTPNPGGVYKAWVIPVSRYRTNGGDLVNQTAGNCVGKNGRPVRNPNGCNKPGQEFLGFDRDPGFGGARDEIKTDNFKVRELVPPSTVTILKFWDKDGDGVYEPDSPDFEPLITEDGSGVCVEYQSTVNVLSDVDPQVVSLDETCATPDSGDTGWAYDWEEPGPTNNIFFTGDPAFGDVRVTGAVGNYTACESLPKNWAQTAAYLDGGSNLVTNTTDDFTCVTVTINSITGENHTILFGNVQRRYTKIVLTCDETDNTLVLSVVDEDGTLKDTIVGADVFALGTAGVITIGGSSLDLNNDLGAFEEFLCTRLSLGAATFGGQLAGTYELDVEVPDDPTTP